MVTKRHSPAGIGEKFGKLLVIGEAVTGILGSYIPCMCECGIPVFVLWSKLNEGSRTRCGRTCGTITRYKKERLYSIWSNMKDRCLNPNTPSYKTYGGRGITVCDAWMKYTSFREWAHSVGYSDTLTLERINNNLGYHPDNCCWITRSRQALNKTSSIRIEMDGEIKILSEWAKDDRCKVRYQTAYMRITRAGWNPIDAITLPAGCKKPKASENVDGG